MLHPYIGVVLSVSLLHGGVFSQSTSKLSQTPFVQVSSIEADLQSNPTTNLYKSYNQSFDYYKTQALPKIEQIAQQRLAEEQARQEQARLLAEEQARQEQARLLAEEQARQKATQKVTAKVTQKLQNNNTTVYHPVAQAGDWEGLIRERCSLLGCNADQVIRVMYCESGGRTNATNPAGYYGLFQFHANTFQANARRIGLSNPNIWDGVHQVYVATAMFAAGQAGQWGCK
jgi:soluble lytic murein transglycosylase-like protein